MEYYDFQMIEGCKVYSYTVEGPTHPRKKKRAKHAALPQKSGASKKRLLTVLLLLLSPAAFLLDTLYAAVTYLPRRMLSKAEKQGYASVIGTVSCFLILSAVLLAVL